jgi:hypothetical protein
LTARGGEGGSGGVGDGKENVDRLLKTACVGTVPLMAARKASRQAPSL